MSREDARAWIHCLSAQDIPVTAKVARKLYALAEYELPGYLIPPAITHLKYEPMGRQMDKFLRELEQAMFFGMKVPAKYFSKEGGHSEEEEERA